MSRLHSFITLLWLAIYSLGMPLADDDDDDNDNDCWSQSPLPMGQMVVSATPVHIPDSPSGAILAPYEHPPIPHPSPSQYPHATLPVSHRSQTPAILGTVFGIVMALVAVSFTARYVIRRRRFVRDPFKDPPKPRFTVFRFRPRSIGSKRRLSDESWVSPTLPALGSPGSPLTQDLELSRYAISKAISRRKLVPVTTPVCTPTDTEFGSRLEFGTGDPNLTSGSVVPVPPVRVPSPVYISPFTPSPSLTSSSSSLSPTPSTEPLTSPSPNPARLSRLLSSTFGVSRVVESPARPTTAHLIHTARSYAHAYRPSSATTPSLYTLPTPSARVSGTRSRISFYPGPTMRDTFSTVTTSDTDTAPYLLRAVAEDQLSTSPFADPDPRTGNVHPVTPSASASSVGQSKGTEGQARAPMGTKLGLKLRLSDASEHARYRLRERERQREREREQGEQRLSTEHELVEVEGGRKEFKLRDSESVLREIGW